MIIEELPHYKIIENWIAAQRLSAPRHKTFFVGINAPQGAGKTTLCNYLIERFTNAGLRSLALSIDDFYLTHQAQLALAQAHPENLFWQARGYPGTHDIELGYRVLESLSAGGDVRVPRYDKSAFFGKGDRMPENTFALVTGFFDIVLLEGWMLGFPPIVESTLEDPRLALPNSALPSYQKWLRFLNAFIQIEAEKFENIVQWRVQAESTLRNSGKSAMSDTEVQKYAESFLPAYRSYVPALRENPPLPADQVLRLKLNLSRLTC